eukprot:364735-Chlamydomonas_euryale.AAC.7
MAAMQENDDARCTASCPPAAVLLHKRSLFLSPGHAPLPPAPPSPPNAPLLTPVDMHPSPPACPPLQPHKAGTRASADQSGCINPTKQAPARVETNPDASTHKAGWASRQTNRQAGGDASPCAYVHACLIAYLRAHMHAWLRVRVRACRICMRGPERLPFCETEAGWAVHKTGVEAACRGLSRLCECV